MSCVFLEVGEILGGGLGVGSCLGGRGFLMCAGGGGGCAACLEGSPGGGGLLSLGGGKLLG